MVLKVLYFYKELHFFNLTFKEAYYNFDSLYKLYYIKIRQTVKYHLLYINHYSLT